jgi:SAM-dependent methyltransferase
MLKENICRLCRCALPQSPDWKLSNYPPGVQYFPKEAEIADDRGVAIEVFCDTCGLVQLPTAQVLYTDGITSATSYSPAMMANRREQIQGFVSRFKLKSKKILDVGCGDGHILPILSESGLHAYGIEPSVKAAGIARGKGLRVTQGFMSEKLLLRDGPFDAFVSFHVMEHVPDLADFVRGIRANLSPGAVGLIEVPSIESVLEYDRVYEIFPDHLNYFSIRTLRLTLELHGFEVLEARTISDGAHNVAFVRRFEVPDLAPSKIALETIVKVLRDAVQSYHAGGREVALWGAGSQNLVLLSQTGPLPIRFVVDSAGFKQGLITTVSHHKIVAPATLKNSTIGVVIITAPWYETEICLQLQQIGYRGSVLSLRGAKLVELGNGI